MIAINLYLHVDRTSKLIVGDIIEKEVYKNESLWQTLAPIMDKYFLEHLENLCQDGLSLHGARYLIKIINQNTTTDMISLFTEIYFEYVRFSKFPKCPSRLQSFFAFKEYQKALDFSKKSPKSKIFEIEFSNRAFCVDANLLKLDFSSEKQEANAIKYWSGDLFETSIDYVPNLEYLVDIPVKIIKEILPKN